jgi:hypothetical protein
MSRAESERLKARLYELCPEMEQIGVYPIVLTKENRH